MKHRIARIALAAAAALTVAGPLSGTSNAISCGPVVITVCRTAFKYCELSDTGSKVCRMIAPL